VIQIQFKVNISLKIGKLLNAYNPKRARYYETVVYISHKESMSISYPMRPRWLKFSMEPLFRLAIVLVS
jgi:hypothetical protein